MFLQKEGQEDRFSAQCSCPECAVTAPWAGGISFLCLCFAEVMKASQQAIERGVKDCLFVDYKRRSGHFDVTTVASIKEITEKVPVA